MSSLNGNLISSTYQSLIKTTDNLAITGSVQLSDGNGNNIPIIVSTTAVIITGSLNGNASNAITLNSTASAIFAITGSNTFTGTQVVSGSLRLFENASFTLPTSQPATAVAGTAFFSGSFLYIYNGSVYKSASLS